MCAGKPWSSRCREVDGKSSKMKLGQPKIQDYAIIGDGRSAALISNRGSIDWLCWPRFDSAAIFAAILDPDIGGRWQIRPLPNGETSRRYLERTNVLETTYTTPAGTIVLTDFMPVTSEEEKGKQLWPEHEILRLVECRQGAVDLQIDFAPRPDYGRSDFILKNSGKLGWKIETCRGLFTLLGETEFVSQGDCLSANLTLKAGETAAFSFSYSAEAPAVISVPAATVRKKLNLTVDWWRQWAAQSNYRGPYEHQVTRSALVLKLLSYAPSGAIIAAPTTSLPETIGGESNWDYRFAWLRDAAFTLHALFGLGYNDDAEAFVDWLLHATRLTRPELQVLYDVFGRPPPRECELTHLRGYANSRPVRVGNAASDQLQLDLYGEVVEAVSHFFGERKQLDRDTQKMLRQCAEYVCQHWREPDNGMWEYRDQRRPYTHSRLLCWVTLDRVLKMSSRGQLRGIDREKCKKERAQIRSEIEENAWNAALGMYAQASGSEKLDANALLLAYYGFEPASSQRMQQTHERIREKLVPRPGMVYRNEQSLGSGEGAFALCSFWEIDFLARAGKLEDAHRIFKTALSYANELDLFAEEIDPENGDALGNFPQAFTHLGVINAALTLRDGEDGNTQAGGDK